MYKLLAATALLVVTSLPLPAQDTGVESNLPGAGFGAAPVQTPQSAPAVPTIEVYTRETIVDVTVTDAHGNPIRNLTRADFTISEDKKPQPIRGFSESGLATLFAPAAVQPVTPTLHSNDAPPRNRQRSR